MARVVAVHGIHNTFSGPDLMASVWRPALLSGLSLAGGAGLLVADDIGCVFYGDVFRRPGRRLGDDAPFYEPVDVEEGFEADLLAAWWAVAAQTDPSVVAPDARTLGVRDLVQRALSALLCSRFAANISESTLIFWPKQVRAYLTDSAVRATIQGRFADAIGPDTTVVVAHSLGSVVAYEGLCAPLSSSVATLVTLGSPLGIPLIRDRLTQRDGWPPGVTSWTNIADRVDFVAAVKQLRLVFGGPLEDVLIDNGLRAHEDHPAQPTNRPETTHSQ